MLHFFDLNKSINPLIEFFSLVGFLSTGIYLFLYLISQRSAIKARKSLKLFIAVSFLLNVMIIFLWQVTNLDYSNTLIYSLWSILFLIQICYPMTLYLLSLTEKKINLKREIMTSFQPLVITNILTIVLINNQTTIPKIYLIIPASIIISYTLYRIVYFALKYIGYTLKTLNNSSFKKNSILGLTLLMVGAMLFLTSIINVILIPIHYISSCSMLILSIVSIIIVINITKEENRVTDTYSKFEDPCPLFLQSDIENEENYKYEQLKKRLDQYFTTEKPYLNKSICIKDVASYLFTNKTYLSKVINESSGLNFNQYVNSYRIKEVDNILKNDITISMKELCGKLGFGCMASFAVAFRINKGTSPAEWCKAYVKNIRKEREFS